MLFTIKKIDDPTSHDLFLACYLVWWLHCMVLVPHWKQTPKAINQTVLWQPLSVDPPPKCGIHYVRHRDGLVGAVIQVWRRSDQYPKQCSSTKGLSSSCVREKGVLLLRTEYFLGYWFHGEILINLFSSFNNTYLLPHSYILWDLYSSWKKARHSILLGFTSKIPCFPLWNIIN